MPAADALRVSAIRRSGHACLGRLKCLFFHPASGVGFEISDQRILTCLTEQNFRCEISGRRKGDRLRVQGVETLPPDDTEHASLSRATPSGFPKRTRTAMLSGTREHHTPDDSISYPDMLSGSLTKVSKPYYSPRSAALPMMGLLEFKAFLKLNNEHADFLLPSWIDNNTSECCNWERVICNPTTGRVKKLFFNDITRQHLEDNWYYYENVKFWLLNVSLFLPFEELHHLNLSANSFDGFIENEELSIFGNLMTLDLRDNRLNGSLSIQVVILGSDNNKFEVETEYPVGWVPLFQLKALFLSNCKLTGDIPDFLQYQFKLEVVDLSHNNLTGRFTNWLLENNTRLEFLVLRNNSLMGQLLPLRPNTRILSLDISHNQLDGRLQENVGHMIPNIVFLNLSNNGFEGLLPSSIAEMSSLRVLDLSANNFSGEVPKQLLATKDLVILKLSYNKFHGEIFSRDFNMTGLDILYLDNNQFMGTLSNVISGSSQLMVLDVSNNYMSGEIPSGIGNMTELRTLVMGNNNFRGKLPPEISQLQQMKFLDVSQNALSGSLPSLKSMEYLEHLHLQGNMFTGLIPRDFLNSSDLLTLDMRDNRLFGSIPNSISALLELRILLLRGNLFSGFIPNHLCHLTKISLMDLSNNSFSGPIPKCFGDIRFGEMKKENDVFRQFIDFGYGGDSRNLYVGFTVKKWEFDSDVYDEKNEVEFVTKNRHDSYSGDILNFMFGLDLSCNNLTGEIPHKLGKLSWIHALNLSHNQLKDSIPKSFSNLSQIESLDLSYNKLSGEIPLELVELNFLEVFSVAYNNISGRVPDTKAQFGTFDERSYEGNPFLCGTLLKRKCNTSIEPPCAPSQSFERFVTILYINPYWRHRWFNFIEECIYSCYYFVFDNLSKLSAYLYN
uniref:Leucine-rich repeat-containing N-terminal plant-type domain-containing protein n=1 Tax=Vitis vinifera TaxID=29760 RepID=F6HXI1_VITVI